MSRPGYFRRRSLGYVPLLSSHRSRRKSRFGSRAKISAHLSSSSKERVPLLHRDARVSVLLGQVVQQHQQQRDSLLSLIAEQPSQSNSTRSSHTHRRSSSSFRHHKSGFQQRRRAAVSSATTSTTTRDSTTAPLLAGSFPSAPTTLSTSALTPILTQEAVHSPEEEEEGEENRRDWRHHQPTLIKTLRNRIVVLTKCNGILRRERSDLKTRIGTLLGDLETAKRCVLDVKKSSNGFEVEVFKRKLQAAIDGRMKVEQQFHDLQTSYQDELASLQEERNLWERKHRESDQLAMEKSRELDSLLGLNRKKTECAEAQQMSHLACQDELTAAREKSRRLKTVVEQQRLDYDQMAAKVDGEMSSLMEKVRQRTRSEKFRFRKLQEVHQNRISDLQGQLHQMELKSEEIRSALVKEVRAKDSEITLVTESKKAAAEKFRELQQVHETEIAHLQARLLESSTKIRESGNATAGTVAEKNSEIASLKNELLRFQRAASAATEEIARLTSRLERSKLQSAKLRKLLSSRDSSSSETICSQKSRIESLQAKGVSAEARIQELSRTVSQRDLRIKSLIEELQIAKRTEFKVRKLSQLNAQGSGQIQSLSECVSTKDREIDSLRTALVEQERSLREKTEEMEKFTRRMRAKVTDLSETSDQGSKQIESLRECVQTKDREIEGLRSFVEAQERKFKGELSSVEASLIEKTSEVAKLIHEMSTARKGCHCSNPEEEGEEGEEGAESKKAWQCSMAKSMVERRLLNSFQDIEDSVRQFVKRYRFVGGLDWDVQLSQDLVEETRPTNPVEAIWSVAAFLAAYLTYDKSASYQDPTTAMMNSRTMCQGYSQLFELLMNRLGILTVVVVGLSRDGSGEIVTETSSPTNHAWNMVTFSGQSYLLDVTNSKSKEPECDSLLETRWMLCPPEKMIQTNFPSQDHFQLLDPPVSFEQFDESVVVKVGSGMFGVRPLSHHQRRIDCQVGEECCLEFEANEGCVLLPQLGGKHGTSSCFVQYSPEKNLHEICFRATGGGLWNLEIYAGLPKGDSVMLNEALVYNIHASGDNQADLEYPEQTIQFKTAGCCLVNPRRGRWKRGSQERIRIRVPGGLSVKYKAGGGGQMDFIRRDNDLWESSFVDASNGGRLEVFAEFEETSEGRLTPLLEFNIR